MIEKCKAQKADIVKQSAIFVREKVGQLKADRLSQKKITLMLQHLFFKFEEKSVVVTLRQRHAYQLCRFPQVRRASNPLSGDTADIFIGIFFLFGTN